MDGGMDGWVAIWRTVKEAKDERINIMSKRGIQ